MPYQDKNIKAEVICDSTYHGNRITSFVITYPRIIMAELMMHRSLSRSSASSRAIPVRKQIEKVKTNCFYPSWIGRNQSGMQANEEVDPKYKRSFVREWADAASDACDLAEKLNKWNIHKQITNRLLEPFQYVTSIVTTTEWNNFFALRCHPAAQPELMVLAYRMLEAYMASTPVERTTHVPFGEGIPDYYSPDERCRIAAGRCARVSYENHDGVRNCDDDLALANRLINTGEGQPKHMNPFEHVAFVGLPGKFHRNFKGWKPYRQLITNDTIHEVDYEQLMKQKPEWV